MTVFSLSYKLDIIETPIAIPKKWGKDECRAPSRR